MSANFCLFLIVGILRSLVIFTSLFLQNSAKKWYNWLIINRYYLENNSMIPDPARGEGGDNELIM
jgi:hypothetical protein